MKKKLIRICVTNTDIKSGIRCSCWGCPIARAASRRFNTIVSAGGFGLAVGTASMKWYIPKNKGRYNYFMSLFDSGMKVNPTTFYFEEK